MAEIKVRETWRLESVNGLDQVSFEVEAFENDVKMFTPGATVTRDSRHVGRPVNEQVVTVSWASASGDKSVANAAAQLAVMTRAIELAAELDPATSMI